MPLTPILPPFVIRPSATAQGTSEAIADAVLIVVMGSPTANVYREPGPRSMNKPPVGAPAATWLHWIRKVSKAFAVGAAVKATVNTCSCCMAMVAPCIERAGDGGCKLGSGVRSNGYRRYSQRIDRRRRACWARPGAPRALPPRQQADLGADGRGGSASARNTIGCQPLFPTKRSMKQFYSHVDGDVDR